MSDAEVKMRDATKLVVSTIDTWRSVPDEMRGFVVNELLRIHDRLRTSERESRARGLDSLDAHADRIAAVCSAVQAAGMLLDLIVCADVREKEIHDGE